MALIRCPECGKEVSDQAEVCIHCGYPMKERYVYALVLVNAAFDTPATISKLQSQLDCPSQEEARALIDSAPVVLRRGMGFQDALALYNHFKGFSEVHLVRDDPELEAGALLEREPVPLPADPEDTKGMGFGGTVLAVILGVIAAILILAYL